MAFPFHLLRTVALAAALASLMAMTAGVVPMAHPVRAEAPPRYGGITLEPTQPAKLVELLYQTVDAVVREEGEETFLAVTCTFGLHNTSKAQEAFHRLGFPSSLGGEVRFDPKKFTSITLTIDGRPGAWERETIPTKVGEEVRPVEWYVWGMGFGRDQERTVALKYQLNLGKSALPRFHFALGGAGWRGKVGSARVSLHFPGPTLYSQVVGVKGEGLSFDGKSFAWSRVDYENAEELGASFIKPSLWEAMEKAREDLRRGERAQSHYALGQAYRMLEPEEPSFLSQALAELEKAKELEPSSAPTRWALFQVYSSRGGSYIVPAIGEAEALLNMEGTAGKGELARWLVEAYIMLAKEDEARGQYLPALEYLERATALATKFDEGRLKELAQHREKASLGWALELLKEGKAQEALAVVERWLPPGTLAEEEKLKPGFGPFRVEVEVAGLVRRVTLEVSPVEGSGLGNDLHEELIQVAQGATRLAGVRAEVRPSAHGAVLDLALLSLSAKELEEARRALTQEFLAREKLKELAGVFSADNLTPQEVASPFHEASYLEGAVDTSPLEEALRAKLDQIEARIRALEGQADTDGVRELRLALLTRHRQGWLEALRGSQVAYRLEASTPGGATASESFSLNLGESRSVTLAARRLKPLTYGAAGGAVLLLVAISLSLRLVRRPKEA